MTPRAAPTQPQLDAAASRIEAYLYGNILVLAALASVLSAEVLDGGAALLVAGTAVSTFVAHLLAHTYGHSIRSTAEPTWADFSSDLRNAVPIASSGVLPVVILLAGLWGWMSAPAAIAVALSTIVVRFLLLGFVTSHLRGVKSTWRTIIAGVALAVAGIAVAALKLVLTH